MADAAWRDGYWRSADGLTLHYRDYAGDLGAIPVICIPGLTRNARDFAEVAERLAGKRRVIVAELRGRGLSEWSPDPDSYNPLTYAADVKLLLEALALPRFVIFGTSLGGIIAMLLGAGGLPGLAGVLLNDIGPVIEEEGLARIRTYVGAAKLWPDWETAAADMASTHAAAYPDFRPADWRAFAERVAKETEDGIILDYDPAIAVVAKQPSPPPLPDPWIFLEGFRSIPVVVVRGALSNILSAETAAEMARRLPQAELVTLPRIGHTPLLTEPAAEAAIDRLLAAVDKAG